MQGSKTPLIVVAAATVGICVGGCTVNNYSTPPPPTQQKQQQPQAQQQATVQPQARAQAVPGARPAPATRNTAAPAPHPPVQAKQPVPSGRTYTIKPGDNLWNISKEMYGDATRYQRILDANPGLNPDNMKPGTQIVIP